MFKFGDAPMIDAATARDEEPLQPWSTTPSRSRWITVVYVVVMILLGFHLRHGFWSAFQSLGWTNDQYLPLLTRLAVVFAVVLAHRLPRDPRLHLTSSAIADAAMPGGH